MKLSAYYNEFDPKASAWIRQLIKNGDIAHGEVDERTITEVSASNLSGFSQHHFFSGIGGWSYALRLAKWSDDRPVWTASLPCQPFSVAGSGKGKSDERHLLPHFLELVRQCKPHTIFGEQVEGAIKHGWLDDLQTNMEAEGYAVGHCVLGAHSIGAAHIRQRLYWVANNSSARREEQPSERRISRKTNGDESRENITRSGWMGNTKHDGRITSEIKGSDGSSIQNSETRADSTGKPERTSTPEFISWIYCRDNKYRPIESGIKPLVDGVPCGMVHSSDTSAPVNADATQEARVMRLKGYGNAIQVHTAAAFIGAYMSLLE